MICALLFGIAFIMALHENQRIAEANAILRVKIGPPGNNTKLYRLEKLNPGMAAFLSGMGLFLSAVLAGTTVVNWQHFCMDKSRCNEGMKNRIPTRPMLVRFLLRGASLSVVVALLCEVAGKAFLHKEIGDLKGLTFANALWCFLIGLIEEAAKLAAVTCCIRLSKSIDGSGCFLNCYCCQPLVENGCGLALAGLAAGYGFMIVENVEYVLGTTLQPQTHSVGKAPGNSKASAAITIIVIVVRVLLNIHPWLTGLSATLLAKKVYPYQDKPHNDTCSIGPLDFICCLWISVLLHALYDFIVEALPLLAIFSVPVIWYTSRWLFWTYLDTLIVDERRDMCTSHVHAS